CAAIGFIIVKYDHYRPGVARRASIYGLALLAVVLPLLWLPSEAPAAAVVPVTIVRGIEIVDAALFFTWMAFLLRVWFAFFLGRRSVRRASGLTAPRGPALNLTARFPLAGPAVFFLLIAISLWAGVWNITHGAGIRPNLADDSMWVQTLQPLWTTRLLAPD